MSNSSATKHGVNIRKGRSRQSMRGTSPILLRRADEMKIAETGRSPAKLAQLAESDDWQVRGLVASNPHTPAEAMRQLRNDPHIIVRGALLKNPNVPPDLLEIIDVSSLQKGQIFWLLQNRSTPASVLDKIATSSQMVAESEHPHQYPEIKRGLAKHPNLSGTLAARFAQDSHPDVRAAAAQHPGLSDQILINLMIDPIAVVRAAATANPRAKVLIKTLSSNGLNSTKAN